MIKQGCAAIVLLGSAGLAFGGGTPPTTQPTGGWLYPEVDFQDGRTREADGRVWPERPLGRPAGGDPEDLGPLAACFAEGYTPTPEQWAALNAALADGYSSRYNAVDRWSGGSNGSPMALSWSFVPDGLSIPSGVGEAVANSELFARMDALFGAANRATWIAQFTNVFNRWAALSGLSYTRVTASGVAWDDGAAWGTAGNDTTRGDVRISMKNIDGGSGILAYNSYPDAGDMVIDRSESWASGAPSYIFLRNTISHEHGHGMGLAHVCPGNGTKLMEPLLNTGFDGPRHDELRASHHFYGDPMESNNSAATATALGTLNAGTTTTIGTIPSPAIGSSSLVSLHVGDIDYYSLSLNEPRLVNITATPNGLTYTDLDQNGDGSCQTTPTNNVNSLAITDLNLITYIANGTTQSRNQNATAAGSAETITGLLMSNGTNYVRVSGVTSGSQVQCYTLSITVTNTNLAPSASDGTFPDFVRVTWPAIPDATGYQVMRNTVNNTTGITTLATIAPGTTYDDATAAPGTTYYYWVRVQQTGSTLYRYTTLLGDPGSRGLANQPPVANAGPDQVVQDADGNLTEPVVLNGSGSSDPDGSITNYHWAEGETTLFNSALSSPVVNLAAGVHTITLTVTDNSGATDSDEVVITVNRRPVANAGPDLIIDDIDDDGDQAVTLDGAGSSDPDGTIANYLWQEGAATLADGPESSPTIALGWGAHTISLIVTDNLGGVHSDTAVITVNRVPVADAGSDQNVLDADNNGSESITLNGSASLDHDGAIANYHWKEGETTLANGASPTANVPFAVGTHTVTLIVTDNRGSTASDTVLITVTPPGPSCDADVNCDGSANGTDVEIMELAVGGDMTDFCQLDPDFNQDGAVNGLDVEAVELVVGGGPCP
ncbi:MAG: hypothetical protein HBSAPP03_20200 [Phycisphaerae bacterium]|nr:MAG: hypothetical protein HBSAPP03_20200 [Phycisphaerae bacterium]